MPLEVRARKVVVDRDGTIYEVFDPSAWALLFGLNRSPARKIKYEQRFIKVEPASEGALLESDAKLC